jgi:arylsulfatase A-like enzyme
VRRIRGIGRWGALLAALIALTSCSGPSRRSGSAVLITIDTWRSDRLGAGGHPDLRTPNLDRFFRGGLQFSEAFSPIPTTLPSHVSMLTGAWPTEHGVPRNAWEVPADLETLAEILGERGYGTGAFVSSAALDASTGVGKGFATFDDEITEGSGGLDAWRPARDTVARALAWWGGRDEPRFLWVHVFEPHLPYHPDPAWAKVYAAGPDLGGGRAEVEWVTPMWADKSRFTDEVCAYLISLYHAEISGVDRTLAPLLRELEAHPEVSVVLTSDHGESLGEHNLYFKHGPKVFPADVRVPLVVRGPGAKVGVSGALVRTIDIPGTLLAMLGEEAELPVDADNLLDWADRDDGLTVFGVASAPHDAPARIFVPGEYANVRMPRAIRRGGTSVVKTPWQSDRTLAFERDEDPDERHALRPEDVPGTDDLVGELDAWMAEARVTGQEMEMDPQLEEQMRSLGYLD